MKGLSLLCVGCLCMGRRLRVCFLWITRNNKYPETFSTCAQLESCLQLTVKSLLWQLYSGVKASCPLQKKTHRDVTALGERNFLMVSGDATHVTPSSLSRSLSQFESASYHKFWHTTNFQALHISNRKSKKTNTFLCDCSSSPQSGGIIGPTVFMLQLWSWLIMRSDTRHSSITTAWTCKECTDPTGLFSLFL